MTQQSPSHCNSTWNLSQVTRQKPHPQSRRPRRPHLGSTSPSNGCWVLADASSVTTNATACPDPSDPSAVRPSARAALTSRSRGPVPLGVPHEPSRAGERAALTLAGLLAFPGDVFVCSALHVTLAASLRWGALPPLDRLGRACVHSERPAALPSDDATRPGRPSLSLQPDGAGSSAITWP